MGAAYFADRMLISMEISAGRMRMMPSFPRCGIKMAHQVPTAGPRTASKMNFQPHQSLIPSFVDICPSPRSKRRPQPSGDNYHSPHVLNSNEFVKPRQGVGLDNSNDSPADTSMSYHALGRVSAQAGMRRRRQCKAVSVTARSRRLDLREVAGLNPVAADPHSQDLIAGPKWPST